MVLLLLLFYTDNVGYTIIAIFFFLSTIFLWVPPDTMYSAKY